MQRPWVGFALLVIAGAAWGATQPLAKVAVSEGYRHFGIMFWNALIGAMILGALLVLRRRRLPLTRPAFRVYVVVALLGAVLPGISAYSAAVHLPAGLLSILLSSVPMLAFPIALALGVDQFAWRRLAGLALGLAGVLLLILPKATLSAPGLEIWIAVALFSSLMYAFEGNVVARWGTAGMDAMQVLCGASLVAAAMVLPLALISGQWIDPHGPWGAPDLAIIGSACLHALAYTLYVYLVSTAGSVFAVQVSYLVTLFGVGWAMLFLNESYSGYIWAALAVMLMGLFFVQPRPRSVLAPEGPVGQTGV